MDPHVLLLLCPPYWTKLPPLGMAYLASYLHSKKYNVHVRDLNITLFHKVSERLRKRWLVSEDIRFQDSLFDCLLREIPDEIETIVNDVICAQCAIVGFSVFRSNRIFSMRLAEYIKSRDPQIKIVFGGPEVTSHSLSGYQLFPADIGRVVDHMITGEGEGGLLAILAGMVADKSMPFVVASQEFDDLDCIPFPRYDEFPLSLYERKRALPFLSSRGCIRTCTFCAELLLSERYRVRSPQNLIEEIQEAINVHDTVWFTFHDSLVNGNLDMLREFCELLCTQHISIKWDAQAAIRDDMDESLLRLMKEAGCFNLFIGLESGSDEVLHSMNKRYNAFMAKSFFEKCHAAGMHFEISLIVGYPGEGEEEFRATMRFLKENRALIPKIAQINPFVVYRGTTICQDLERIEEDSPVEERYNQALRRAQRAQRAERVQRLVDFLKENNFIFTSSFVNNLVYEG